MDQLDIQLLHDFDTAKLLKEKLAATTLLNQALCETNMELTERIEHLQELLKQQNTTIQRYEGNLTQKLA